MAEEVQAQKRSLEESETLLSGVKAVLLDIEGTTTPITFVKDVLFGHVKDNLKDHLEKHWESEELQADIDQLRTQVTTDKEASVEGVVDIPDKDAEKTAVIEGVVANVEWQMSLDRKVTPLKQLQAHVWREAFKTGKLTGSVYDDVVSTLKSLRAEDQKVYIYSSGKVEAHKLLFGYTTHGSLLEYIDGHFDTETGAKVEKDSYTRIAKQIGLEPDQVLFLTDLPTEARPCAEAGMKTCLVVREGNADLTEDDRRSFNVIESFTELCPAVNGESAAKEAKTEEAVSTTEPENGVTETPAAEGAAAAE